MTTTSATAKQIDYLLTLANQAYGTDARYLSQIREHLGLSSFQVNRLDKATASRLITKLAKQTA